MSYKSTFPNRLPLKRLAFLIGFGLIFLILISIPVFGDNPSVVVKDYHMSPSVLMPGETGILTVTLKGTAITSQTSSISSGADVSSTTTTIIPYVESVVLSTNDLIVKDGGSHFEGNIGPELEIPVSFLVQAESSRSGIFFPELIIRVRDGPSLKYPIPVNVNTQVSVLKSPSLTIDNNFEVQIKPGSRITGEIIIGNTGSSQADNIRIMVNGSPPIAITTGISSFLIESLTPGSEFKQSIDILIDKNAPTGLVQIPVFIEYVKLDGTQISEKGGIGLDIRGEAEIAITSVETEPSRVSPHTSFDLIIRVQNIGTGETKTVSAELNLPMEGSKEAFVGKIKSGNDAPATFIFEGTEAGTYPYHVTITWTDDWGTHTIEKDLTLTIADGGDSNGMMILILILVIVGGVGLYLWRRRNGEE